MKRIHNDVRKFVVGFNGKESERRIPVEFNSKEVKEKADFNSKFRPEASSVEEIYYDEIVIYDGGGVEGYGDS